MPKTILIVDDEEHMQRLLQFALRPVNAVVATAKSGAAAIEFFKKSRADLIILDYSMPGKNGVEALQELRRLPNGADVPVLMLTARDQTLIRKEAAGLQVAAFLTKPFSPSDLQRRAKDVLGAAPATTAIPPETSTQPA